MSSRARLRSSVAVVVVVAAAVAAGAVDAAAASTADLGAPSVGTVSLTDPQPAVAAGSSPRH